MAFCLFLYKEVIVMKYEGQICRSPMERGAFMLPVMVGCNYNRCSFCNLFRHLNYRILPLGQIEAELLRVKKAGGNPRRIFLGDGNAFCLDTSHLLEILKMIHAYFPDCNCINMDATVSSILTKSDKELKALFDNGIRHLYIGIETGLNDILLYMKKEHNLKQAYDAVSKLQNAGLIFDAHIMTGIAGKNRGLENAEALADFFNQTHPVHIVNFSLFLHRAVPLWQEIQKEHFVPASELENLQEEQHLLKLFQPSSPTNSQKILYDGFHDFISVRIRGTLPDDQEKMLKKLADEISRQQTSPPVFAIIN